MCVSVCGRCSNYFDVATTEKLTFSNLHVIVIVRVLLLYYALIHHKHQRLHENTGIIRYANFHFREIRKIRTSLITILAPMAEHNHLLAVLGKNERLIQMLVSLSQKTKSRSQECPKQSEDPRAYRTTR